MAKELFMEKQQPVQVIADKDLLYVFICLNGKEKIVDSPDLGDSDNASPISYIEYDYNQFVVNRDSINLDDLMINPDKYLDYAANPELDNLKLEKIAQSKNALAGYLSSHPLFSDAKYAEGRYYTVTEEKQRQLTSKMAMYNLYSQQSLEYPLLKWNDVGNICEDWTVEEMTWYNNNFKPSDSNKELPMKLRLNLQRNISALIDNAQSFEKVCREMWDDVQKGFLTDEKSREVKEMKKDESGEEKEIVSRVVKEEFREEYQQKNKEMSEKIEELSKETEIYSIRLFDLDEFADSLPKDTILSVDDLFMLTFMDENGENIVQD